MNAKHKLNRFNVLGSVGVAAFLGFVTSSWFVFVLFGAIFLGMSYQARGIRL